MAFKSHKLAPKLAAATAVAAAFSMLAIPAAAVELPAPAHAEAYDGDAGNAHRDRRWRRDRGGVDVGDVLAGVLILGTIAAVADAAKDRRDDRDYRYPERYPYPGDVREGRYPYPDEDAGYRAPGRDGYRSGGMDRAVDMCVGEVEQGGERVGSVNSALRDDAGWYVSGELAGGAAYSCRIGNDGRISDVRVDGYEGSYGYGSAPAEPVEDYEYDDEYYSQAREREGYADPGAVGDDGRYATGEAPDFEY